MKLRRFRMVLVLIGATALIAAACSNSNSTSQSSSHSSSSSSMAPTPTSETLNPGQTTTAAPKGGSTPGFELVALVGALAVALVLVRRKL